MLKTRKYIFLFLFFLSAFVPTELFHYVHVFSDLSEHYEHHKNLSFTDFLSHALNEKETDKSHPEHSHSPFTKHHSVCATNFVSVLPEFEKIIIEKIFFTRAQDEKGVVKITSSFKDVYISIWQPPKLV